jgi:membrane-associated phospholipid phosphatase
METLIDLFLPVSIWFQGTAGWLVKVFQAITFLGSTQFYILFMPVLFWCIDTALGIRIGIMLLVSGGINNLLKFSFQWPRPFWVTPQVHNLTEATGFGFPSGHAQTAAGIWGLMATSTTKRWIRWGALAAIPLIGLSRIVLGVHFTHDVLAGWLVGSGLLWLYLRLEEPLKSWFKTNSIRKQILALLLSTALLIVPAFFLVPAFNPPAVPQDWIAGAGEIIQPYSYDDLLTTSGSFLGLGLGVILLLRASVFSVKGRPWQLVVRYLVGIIGVLLLYLGLGSIFPDNISALAYGLRFFRYFLIGFWISYGAPMVFTWLRLTRVESPAS